MSDKDEVMKTITEMTESFHKKDLSGVLATYEEGASVIFEPGREPTEGSAIAEGFRQAFGLSPRFTYSGHDVIVEGDTAVHFAPWKMKATAPDGTAIQAAGLSVAVLRRQSDRSWKLVIDNPHAQSLWEEARAGSDT